MPYSSLNTECEFFCNGFVSVLLGIWLRSVWAEYCWPPRSRVYCAAELLRASSDFNGVMLTEEFPSDDVITF